MPRRIPLTISHQNYSRDDNRADLVAKTVKVCHMDRGEAALLMFYASCSSGFQPSAALIAEKCGVKKNYVNTLRQQLINKGIAIMVGNQLCIDWDRIKIMASLNPAHTAKKGWVKPIPPIGIDRIGKVMERWPTVMDLYTLPLDELIERLGRMPQWVYKAWRAQVNRELKAKGAIRANEILG